MQKMTLVRYWEIQFLLFLFHLHIEKFSSYRLSCILRSLKNFSLEPSVQKVLARQPRKYKWRKEQVVVKLIRVNYLFLVSHWFAMVKIWIELYRLFSCVPLWKWRTVLIKVAVNIIITVYTHIHTIMNAGVRNIRVKKKVQSLALISSLRFFQVLFHHGSELDTEYPRCFPTSGVYMWSNRYPHWRHSSWFS